MAEISREKISFKVDSERVVGAYPELVINDMITSFNEQKNEYIAKQLISLNIDKDVLIKQTEEIRRLNNIIQSYEDKLQKLEKIEHIICDIGECEELTDDIGSKYEKYCEPNYVDCHKCMIKRIEQIIKGGDNNG